MLPVRHAVTFYQPKCPSESFMFGTGNAIFLAMIVSLLYFIENREPRGSFLIGFTIYVIYQLYEHRKVFVLHGYPSDFCIFGGGYLGKGEAFWRFVEETKIPIDELERKFWEGFWIPLLMAIAMWDLCAVMLFFKPI